VCCPELIEISITGCESLFMAGKFEIAGAGSGSSRENIAYVKQMLAELAHVARKERADLLAYLLEMAFTEASDLIASIPVKSERDQPARMAIKPAGKI
jgi:hypothetical protein